MSNNQKFRKSRRGVATVEFALVVPILLSLVIGIMEFGWLIRDQLIVANAAREGVRFAALGNSSTNVKVRIKNAASGLKPALTDNQIALTYASDTSSASPAYYSWPGDSASKNTVTVGNLIRVTVSYQHSSLTGFFPFFKDKVITVPVTMARELN